MIDPTEEVLDSLASEMQRSKESVLNESLKAFIERELRHLKAEFAELTTRYGVGSVEEMDAKYRDGSLEEFSSWRDFQRLDLVQYKLERYSRLLERLK